MAVIQSSFSVRSVSNETSTAALLAATGEGTGTDSSEAFTATDGSPSTELVAVIDFNRLYDSNGDGSGTNKTEYGNYFEVLETCHSLNTEDAAYVIQKCIDNDSTGEWTSLKDSVDASVADADDLMLDLASFLNAVEAVESSMNFKRDDENIASAAVEFLQEIGTRSYERDPSQASFTVSSIYNEDTSSFSNTEIVQTFIESFRSNILFSDDYESLVNYLKTDLNTNHPWSEIDKLGSTVNEKLVACSEIISRIMAVSSGAALVEQDDINDEVAFDISNPVTIFYGTKLSDGFPFYKKISDLSASRAISLPFLQYHLSDKTVLPLETDDPTVRDGAGRICLSGPRGLVRKPISEGDLNFTDLDSYCQTTVKNFGTITKFLTHITGRFDTSSQVSPPEILRIIVNQFINATKTATASDSTKFQFAALTLAAYNDAEYVGEGFENNGANLRQLILQTVGRLKWYETLGVLGASGSETGKVTLLTTRTSENSSVLQASASPTTIQIEDKSAAVVERVVGRRASNSPTETNVAAGFFALLFFNTTGDSGAATAYYDQVADLEQTIAEYAEVAAEEIVDLDVNDLTAFIDLYIDVDTPNNHNLDKSKFRESNIESIKNSIINASTSDIEKIVNEYDTVQQGRFTKDKFKRAKQAFEAVLRGKQAIDDLLQTVSNNVVTDPNTIKSIFETVQTSSSDNVFNYILNAYDQILSAATERLPADATITNSAGYTKYIGLDEFALLSLIVECFVRLAGLLGTPFLTSGTVSTTEARTVVETNAEGTNIPITVEDNVMADGISLDSYSLADIGSLQSGLEYVIGDNYATSDIAPSSYAEPYSAFVTLMGRHEKVRNSAAYMSSYLSLLSKSKDELVTITNDLVSSSTRSDVIKTEDGYKMLSDLTTQQIIRRRSMLDKYRPQTSKGYVPARASYYSSESSVFDLLLQSSTFATREAENIRIAAVGIPAGFLPSSLRPGTSGMVKIDLHRKDYELSDISFSPKTYIFDPRLFIQPGGFSNNLERLSFVADDYITSLARKANFVLYSRDVKQVLRYDALKSDSRYSSITDTEFDQIVRNTFLSYMMETYLYKLSGKIFDETLTIRFNDSTSDAGRAALKTSSALGLAGLVLPNSDQLDQIFNSNGEVDHLKKVEGITTGDKELIDAISSSFLMRNDTVLNRAILPSNFDRVFLIPFDLDEFKIDLGRSETDSGGLATDMVTSLIEKGWVEVSDSGEISIVINRDPINGGVSIGNVCCQASLHLASMY
jgi:hypothetical protein